MTAAVLLEKWQEVWRKGVAPSLSTAGLEALAKALREDDQRLTQGSTTTPPPLTAVADYDVEAGDAIAFCGWQGDGLKLVGNVEKFFARVCFECDNRIGVLAACRHFLNWFDDTPRNEMRARLLAEVELTLSERQE